MDMLDKLESLEHIRHRRHEKGIFFPSLLMQICIPMQNMLWLLTSLRGENLSSHF